MTLDATEFIRRFLLHVLPRAFVRIRQFGFLANRARGKKLSAAASCLAHQQTVIPAKEEGCANEPDRKLCPVCGLGHMVRIGIIPGAPLTTLLPPQDSS